MSDPRQSSLRRGWVGVNVTASLLLAAALLLMVNWLAARQWVRGDWTAGDLYSISERTEQILRGLDAPVAVTVFLPPGDPTFDGVRELLARMAAVTDRLTVEYLDPDRDRDRAKALLDKFQIYDLSAVVFACGERSRYVTVDQMVDFDFSRPDGTPRFTGFKAEEAMVTAVLDVSEARRSTVCVLSGHGERDPEGSDQEGLGTAATAIRRANYQVRPVDLVAADSDLAGCDLVLAAGPLKPYGERSARRLADHLGGGGRLLLLLDPRPATDGTGLAASGLEALLAPYGIRRLPGLVLDPEHATPLNPGTSFHTLNYGSGQGIRPLAERKIPTVFSRAQAWITDPAPAGVEVERLVQTAASAWSETDLDTTETPAPDAGEPRGPLLLALTAAGAPPRADPAPTRASRAPRLALVADSDFAANWLVTSAGNLDLLLALIHWLAEKEQQIAIAPKDPAEIRLSLSGAEMASLFWTVVTVLPLCAVVLGAAVHWRRRK